MSGTSSLQIKRVASALLGEKKLGPFREKGRQSVRKSERPQIGVITTRREVVRRASQTLRQYGEQKAQAQKK